MKPKYAAISLAVVLFVMPIQGQKPQVPQPDQGRYQLLPVPLSEGGVTSQELFLFDSQTGRVWHFRPESSLGENGPGKLPTIVLEAFIPVTIWTPNNGQKVSPDGN